MRIRRIRIEEAENAIFKTIFETINKLEDNFDPTKVERVKFFDEDLSYSGINPELADKHRALTKLLNHYFTKSTFFPDDIDEINAVLNIILTKYNEYLKLYKEIHNRVPFSMFGKHGVTL